MKMLVGRYVLVRWLRWMGLFVYGSVEVIRMWVWFDMGVDFMLVGLCLYFFVVFYDMLEVFVVVSSVLSRVCGLDVFLKNCFC